MGDVDKPTAKIRILLTPALVVMLDDRRMPTALCKGVSREDRSHKDGYRGWRVMTKETGKNG